MGLDTQGRIASRLSHRSGVRYAHIYYQPGESVLERVPFDVHGRRVFIPHTDVEFFSFNDGAEHGSFTYDTIHGELLKMYSLGGYDIYIDNSEHPGGGDGSWDLLHPLSTAAVEQAMNPGIYINPIDGDISVGNLVLHVYY